MMMVDFPRAKKNPVPSGRFPSAMSLRVVLSIAEMWSASNAWRVAQRPRGEGHPEAETKALNWKWWG